jgi:hypothetical protein
VNIPTTLSSLSLPSVHHVPAIHDRLKKAAGYNGIADGAGSSHRLASCQTRSA